MQYVTVCGMLFSAVGGRGRTDRCPEAVVALDRGADSPAYLKELRLQNLERLNVNELLRLARLSGKAKVQRAAAVVAELAAAEATEYELL